MIKRPEVRPKYQRQLIADRRHNRRVRWAVLLTIVCIVSAIWWRYTAFLLLSAVTGIIALPQWFMAVLVLMDYGDQHRRY